MTTYKSLEAKLTKELEKAQARARTRTLSAGEVIAIVKDRKYRGAREIRIDAGSVPTSYFGIAETTVVTVKRHTNRLEVSAYRTYAKKVAWGRGLTVKAN